MARYAIEEYVRWEDIDAAGIINYQAYLRFFGLAEAEMLRSCGLSYAELVEEIGIWLPRARVVCEFYVPVRLDELLVVHSWFGHVGKSSIHIDFEVTAKRDPKTVVARGKYVLVAVKQGAFTSTPVPDAVREKIAPYVEEGEGLE
ncbi:MAG: acyl-CoA thioesterase [Acidobacteria bacterium]|nr:acyl-CoA thioesterase [Acidobacteriota bacterium]